jgi:RimJ/RimL family protein N-acetyltransferase
VDGQRVVFEMALDEEALAPPFLETAGLVLRRFTEADVDLLIELDSDPDVMRFITGGTPTSREEIENEVLPAFISYYERFDGYGFWAAIERETGGFIGWFHLRPDPTTTSEDPELGYRLRAAAWGKGYATEGARALIDKAFRELGANRVVASTMAVNIASRRVMEKAGLRFVKVYYPEWLLSIDGGADGGVEYAVDKADWDAVRTTDRNTTETDVQ